MLIAVTGNIASGKSTLCAQLYDELRWPVLAIDTYRKRYNPDADLQIEKELWRWMMDDVAQQDKLIIEMTGASQNYPSVLHAYTGSKLIIRLQCPDKTCEQRYHQRMTQKGYKPSPVPYKNEDIMEAIEAISDILDVVPYDLKLDSTKDIDVSKILKLI